jgi:uncharacterized membrane protein
MNATFRSHARHLRTRAGGSILINTAVALSLIVITLIGTEIGFMYFMKREFQKTADLAALAGAQQVRSGCAAAVAAAQLNANGTTGAGNARNMPIGQSLLPGEVQCGYWDRTTSFQTPATSGPENAVRVTFQKPSPTLLPQLFTGDRRIAISAVAALSAPVASFSVGTKLVVVKDDSLLGRALKAIGLDLKGSLAGYDGLAQVKITPTGLLEAFDIKVSADIGVGELNALLNAKTIKLSELLDATARAVGMEELLNANIDLLKAINAKVNIGDPDVRLGSLLQITGPDGPAGSALTTGINALDIFTTSIGIATQKHAIAINDLSAAGLVKARVALIEPPSIAVGGIGATAYTGQLRTFVQIGTGNIPIVGSIINLNLPIMIDAVNGKRHAHGDVHARIANTRRHRSRSHCGTSIDPQGLRGETRCESGERRADFFDERQLRHRPAERAIAECQPPWRDPGVAEYQARHRCTSTSAKLVGDAGRVGDGDARQ